MKQRWVQWRHYATNVALFRTLLGGVLLIIGGGRLGLFSYSSPTTLPGTVYGVLMLTGGVALWLTARWRSQWQGRVAALYGAALCFGFGFDLLMTHGSMTSILTLWWYTVCAGLEGLTEHEC